MITVSERLRDENEALRKLLDNFSASLRVASPGIVRSFDASKQTVTVEIAIREKINNGTEFEDVAIPVLVDVPVFMPRAGGYTLTLPIAAGDECLVIFGDNCMDGWWQSGDVQNQMDKRRHDLSDGYAICGIWSQPRKLSGYSTTYAELRNTAGTTKIKIKDNEIDLVATTLKINGEDWMLHTHTNGNNGADTGGVVVL